MFWDNFVTCCQKSNTTPTAVTKELNISSGNVTAWKNGRLPRWSSLAKIADYFGITPNDLITDKPVISDNSLSNNTINGNHNIIGHNNEQQATFDEKLSSQEQELISLFRKLSEVNKARALIHISELSQGEMMT